MINSSLNQEYKPSFIRNFKHQWAREGVFSLLRKISYGSLTLVENGDIFHFNQSQGNSDNSCTITIKHQDAYLYLLRKGEVGAGEAYIKGLWETDDLVQLIRVMVRNMAVLEQMDKKQSFWRRIAANLYHRFRNNSPQGAKRNIAEHYDLSNEFFNQFLDSSMAYSAAIYGKNDDALEKASLNKFEIICGKLKLKASDHLLEIGTGWGGLAIYAAKKYGCRVTTITLSQEQYVYAKQWVEKEKLSQLISVLKKDYRKMVGQFDKLVSIEMIEAVGAKYYSNYFKKCSELLVSDGLMLIQGITISDQRYHSSVTTTDFIKSYIFPGGQLPSNQVICENIANHTDMQLIGLQDITYDYALTLTDWRKNFLNNMDNIKSLHFSSDFIRKWYYYLCYCEGGFRERVIHTAQFLLAKPEYR